MKLEVFQMFRRAWLLSPPTIRVLNGSNFLMYLGFYVLVPYLALHLSGKLGWSLGLTGLLLGTRQLSQQGLTYFGGLIGDRIGWKRAIVLGVWIRALGFFGIGLAHTVPEFFAAAIISGLGGALFEPANKAAFEAFTPSKDRKTLLALRDTISNIAFAISALAGTLLASVDIVWLSITGGVLFIGAGEIVRRRIPTIAIPVQPATHRGVFSVMKNRAFVLYTFFLTGYFYLYTQMWITIPKVLLDLTKDTSSVTAFYAVVGISITLFQLRLSQWLTPLPRRFGLIGLGTFLMGVSLFSLGYSEHYLLLGFCYALGMMVSNPITFELIPRFAPRDQLAAYYGFNGYALAIGGALSTSLGGWTYDYGHAIGFPNLPWWVCLFTGLAVFGGMQWLEGSLRASGEGAICFHFLPRRLDPIAEGKDVGSDGGTRHLA